MMRLAMWQRSERGLAVLLACAALSGCGSGGGKAEAPPDKITAEDEILAVAKVWQAMEEARGVRNAPEKIARFEIKERSTLALTAGQPSAEEVVELDELFELRSGARFECTAEAKLPVKVRYGRRQGKAAVEVIRPRRNVRRSCRPSDFPEPELTLGGGSSRFRLDDEKLVGFAPLEEKRVFLPIE